LVRFWSRNLLDTCSVGTLRECRFLYATLRNRTSPAPPAYSPIDPNWPNSASATPSLMPPASFRKARTMLASSATSMLFQSPALTVVSGRAIGEGMPPGMGSGPLGPPPPPGPAAGGVAGAGGATRNCPGAGGRSRSREVSRPWASRTTRYNARSSPVTDTKMPLVPPSAVGSARSSRPVWQAPVQRNDATMDTSSKGLSPISQPPVAPVVAMISPFSARQLAPPTGRQPARLDPVKAPSAAKLAATLSS
jgi:hypothetical protein